MHLGPLSLAEEQRWMLTRRSHRRLKTKSWFCRLKLESITTSSRSTACCWEGAVRMWKYYTDPRGSNTLRIYQSPCLRHVQRSTKTDGRDYPSWAPDWLCRRSDIDEADELSAIKKGKDPFSFSHPWRLLLRYEAHDCQDAPPPPLRGARLNIIGNRL